MNYFNPRLGALAMMLVAFVAHAAPGDFDLSYGISGKSFAAVTGADLSYGNAVAIQPDGKIVVAGTCVVGLTLTRQFCALRLLANGFFDASFGNNGSKLVNAVSGATEFAHALTLQSDGKIVLAGACGPELAPTESCVVRLLADGSLDSSFGLGGKARISFGTVGVAQGVQEARAVIALADGKLLLGGLCRGDTPLTDVGPCVVRLNGTGSVDTSFANAGRAIVLSTLFERLTSMSVRADGRILIATEGNAALFSAPEIWRTYVSQLTALGVPDTTFGSSGVTQILLAAQERKPRLALQPDGKVIVGIACRSGTGAAFQCGARLNTTGQIDPTYSYPNLGASSVLTVSEGEYGLKPVLQSDGRTQYVSSAGGGVPDTLDFVSQRALDTGSLDASYTGGGLKPMLAALDRANDAALQSDGKLVIAGTCDNGTSFQICTARLQGDTSSAARNCSMDIDGDGRVYATSDALILARVALGMRGSDVMNGIATTGTRNTWTAVRDYLVNQCGMTGIAP